MAISEPGTTSQLPVVDFSDTKIAFAHKDNRELRRTSWLFRFMNKPALVKIGGAIGLWLNKTGINIFNPLIKATIYHQFCGGTDLEECAVAVAHLREKNTYSILDYGAEGKTHEEEFDQTMEQIKKSIAFAAKQPGLPMVSLKFTALCLLELLEKIQAGAKLTQKEQEGFAKAKQRVDQICKMASENGVCVFIDAEETWIQDPIDRIVKEMMEKYNRDKVIVYQTYQMYRKDKWQEIMDDHQESISKNYLLGAKIVRGAYMEKERKRAADLNYPSPIQDTKDDTDRDYNKAISYCVNHYHQIATCNASHNMHSNLLMAELITNNGLPKDHAHLNFSQLYGMSDNITFNLAAAGYNVAKYLPYGPVREVVPYLIRRARENTAVTGEMSRELGLIVKEMQRRGMK